MRVVIFGSRGLRNRAALEEALQMLELLHGIKPTRILSGAEPTGMDAEGEAWGKEHGLSVERYTADWTRFPKVAGKIRNVQMSKHCDAGVGVVYRGGTPGSRHMERQLVGRQLPVYVVEVDAPAAETGCIKPRD